jgi:hypothetical protein
VLAALVVTAALAAALHFSAAQASRAAGQGVAGERALAAAEVARAGAPALWAAVGAPAVAGSVDRAYALDGGDSAALRLTRVTAVTAWASAVGSSGGARGRARRGASLLLAVVVGPDGVPVLVPVTRRAWSHTY